MTAAPFAYYGGKTMLAPRIVRLLPAHRHYVAGSLAVLLAKPRADHETVNDIDRELMTFWRVLRERREELIEACALTPHSRAEHLAAYADPPGPLDELEVARRVWVRLSQGRGGTLRRTGWRFYCDPAGTGSSMPDYLEAYVSRMPECVRRLHGVSLECRSGLEVIEQYGRHPDALIYADPPYPTSSGRSLNYRVEMGGDEAHRELHAALTACRAAVVLSGYHNPLYDELFGDWHRVELTAYTGQGTGDGRRTEVLWSNRPLATQGLLDFGEVS